jgi:hypothetical protein
MSGGPARAFGNDWLAALTKHAGVIPCAALPRAGDGAIHRRAEGTLPLERRTSRMS